MICPSCKSEGVTPKVDKTKILVNSCDWCGFQFTSIDWAAGLSPEQKRVVQNVMVMARLFFGDEEAQIRWFGAPNHHLNDRAPQDCLFEPSDDDSRFEVYGLLTLMCAMRQRGEL